MTDGAAPLSLRFVNRPILVDGTALAATPYRERLEPFIGPPSSPGEEERPLTLGRAASSSGEWIQFEPMTGLRGGFRTSPSGLELHPDAGPRGAMLGLRVLFSWALSARGGVLLHASGVSVNGSGALVTGVSGAGKSTLARWAREAGALLLSDEVVGVLPDGSLLGTPFYSDIDLWGANLRVPLVVAMTLTHGSSESFEDLPANQLVEELCGQTFQRTPPMPASEALRCLAPSVTRSRTGRFTCRNAPSAGEALRRLIEASSGHADR